MSEYIVFPVEGFSHLIVEEMNRDAHVWGMPDATEIQVTYVPAGNNRVPTLTAEAEGAYLGKASVQRVSIPASLSVTVKRASGDLHIRGLNGEVNAEIVHGDLRLSSLAGTVRVARVDGDLRADEVSDLRLLGNCAGDLRFEGGGNLSAETIAGDVRIAGAGDGRVGRIQGDLWVEGMGALQVERVSGDARLNDVSGPVSVRTLHGDLRALGLTGGLMAPQVQGDATVQGPFGRDQAYSLTTDGDVSLLLPADTDARLVARASGRIRSDVQLAPAGDGTPTFTATIGQGTARINISSSGDLRIAQAGAAGPRVTAEAHGPATPADLRTLGDHIRQQVTASLAAAGITVETGQGGWGSRGARPVKPVRPTPPRPPTPPVPPSRPKSSSPEELRILKMVEEGVITVEQAEMLLKALEG